MRKIVLSLIFILCLIIDCQAGLVDTYHTYNVSDTVTSNNLNGNLNNIRSIVNGGIDNINVDTASGYRLYEILGTLPAVGSQGRIVYYTVENSLNFDNGSQWVKAITITTPTQGDIVYYDGTQWDVLNAGTAAQHLITNGVSANPEWSNVIDANSGTLDNVQIGGTTATGELIVNDSNDYADGLGSQGTEGQFLQSQGTGANPTWVSPANVVFSFSGSAVAGNYYGYFAGTALPTTSSTAGNYSGWFSQAGNAGAANTVISTKFAKIAGISTVTVWAYFSSNNSGYAANVIVDIGGANGTVATSTAHETAQWKSFTVDVSGLSNGTTYDVAIKLWAAPINIACLFSIIGIAS